MTPAPPGYPLSAREERIATEFSRAYYNRREFTWAGNTSWMGVPVLKLPLDLWVVQEIIFETRPEVSSSRPGWPSEAALSSSPGC
jgi:cephalosporin hydroxylase